MVFQATKWGWKRVAARLLLVPVLAGSASAASAQVGSPGGGPVMPGKTPAAGMPANAKPPGPGAPGKPAGDPKVLLKEGRKALSAGNFDMAQDLARQAEYYNPTGRWGLFDDTPNALLKDIQAARQKADKARSEQLTKQAKTLFHKSATTDAERAANLDSALQMARHADQLHGPYSMWDVSDRPDKLAREIEAVRIKLKTPIPTPPGGPNGSTAMPGMTGNTAKNRPPAPGQMASAGGARPATGPVPPNGNNVVPAGGVTKPLPTGGAAGVTTAAGGPTGPVRPTAVSAAPPKAATADPADPKKLAAIKLLEEGKVLANRGEFAAAKAKFREADKLGAKFAPGEYSPGFALQDLNARGADAITRLLGESNACTAKKDYRKADACLNAAADIATALGLFPRPIEEARSGLRLASSGQYGGIPPGGLAPAGGPETLVPAGPPPVIAIKPANPPGKATVGGPMPVPVAAAPATTTQMPATPTTAIPVTAAPMTPTPVAVAPMPTPVAAAPDAPPANSTAATARQMLDQAAADLRRGDLDMAGKLALQAYNFGAQEEAGKLLTTIDAEKLIRKRATAVKSLDAAVQAHANKDYAQAAGVLTLIDPVLLPADKKAKRDELLAACKAEMDKGTAAVVAAAGAQTSDAPVSNPPGTARVGEKAGADNLTNQVNSLRNVTVQKLRTEGLKVQQDAQTAFGRGDTDVAISMLNDYSNKVRAAGLEAASVALLLRPVESKMEMFRVMKGQTDALAREKREKQQARELIAGRGVAEEQRKAEVASLVRRYNALVKEKKYKEAEAVAVQAKQLEPDNEAIIMLAHMAKMQRRVQDAQKLKSDKEELFLQGMNGAEQPGPYVDTADPVAMNLERARRTRGRGSMDDLYQRNMTPATIEIERRLDHAIGMEFQDVPLKLALGNIAEKTGLPITYDTNSIDAEAIAMTRPVSEKLPGLSVRNTLNIILGQSGLGYVIENDTVTITTVKKSKGRLYTKVFSVADLVTPVPNFALPDYANFEKILNKNPLSSGKVMLDGVNIDRGGSVPRLPGGGLGNASPVGMAGQFNMGNGMTGSLSYEPRDGSGHNPLAGSAHLAGERNSKHDQLIRLITSMVRPYSWDVNNGAGRIEYFDLGSALVVNQTADVIREVADLLEALRRLQDLAIAVEVRIISLSETFFERMGVDFAVNINTHSASLQPNFSSGVFAPEPFFNQFQSGPGGVVGLTPAGSFTPDLNVPIRATSFQRAIPPFGGYPNSPGANGGVSLGLAFLNDIQVFMFMEAAQGDRRVNVMQAPKITLFNGQTSTLSVQDSQFFVTDVQVVSVNGQIVFIPQNNLLPGPNTNFQVTVQAVVSADRRFVRLNMPVTLSAQTGATVPLFPVTTFITPVFEGGSQGVPIPFTQFLQQPAFTSLNVQTTVVCPDGGTVLMGGLKTLQEGRNEFGPPFLSKIPYLNRLFKNVGIGRETRHVMLMITPRIIINAEEEIFQTEGRAPPRPGE
jgi:tetratricopeptide (TPR) repeat protein